MIRVAIVVADNRDELKQYDSAIPNFGSAPDTLLQGFAQLPECEIHVISCTQRIMRNPEKLAPNIYFHSLHVPFTGRFRMLYSGSILAIRRRVAEIQPDIVHGQGSEIFGAISAALS